MKTSTLAALALLGGTAEASISTCASAWKSAGGGNCATAVAVCMAESGGNPSSRNVNSDSHRSVDRGLWQINNYWHPEVSDSCAFSAGCNARAALKISSGGSNWTPWATYNGGAYRAHLSEARSACGELAPQEAGFTASSIVSSMAEEKENQEDTGNAARHFGPGGQKRYGPGGGVQRLFGPGATEPVEPDVPPPVTEIQVGGEPRSCTRKLKHLCGHCGMDKSCWVSCAKSHKGQLLAAGCHPPKSEENGKTTIETQEYDEDVKDNEDDEDDEDNEDAVTETQVGGEPRSCTRKLKHLCGHCGMDKSCWVSCAKSHKGQLLAAGCHPPKSEEQDTEVVSETQAGGEPASCTRKLKHLCGHCGGDKSCWVSCAKSHKGQLLAAGCHPPKSEDKDKTVFERPPVIVVPPHAEEQGTPVHTKEDIFLFHEYDQHCAVLGIPGGKMSTFWKEFGYKYDHFKKGRCPHYYNYINKRISDVEGATNVDMMIRGMNKPKRSFRDVVSVLGSANACPSDPCGCCPHDGKGPGACPCLCGGGWCKRCCQ